MWYARLDSVKYTFKVHQTWDGQIIRWKEVESVGLTWYDKDSNNKFYLAFAESEFKITKFNCYGYIQRLPTQTEVFSSLFVCFLWPTVLLTRPCLISYCIGKCPHC